MIAQQPLPERAASRMLVVSRSRQEFYETQFVEFPRHVRPGDCLVLNDTRVFPARLLGRRNSETGAEVEVFLVHELSADTVWQVLVRPGKRVRTGDVLLFSPELRCEVLTHGEFGERTVRFISSEPVRELFERLGRVPLPPYIHREPDSADRDRYQTVYAQASGSVAAPTAGLHFTEPILEACRDAGAQIARVTLHVGLGTFAPVRASRVEQIQLHEEHFEITEDNARIIREAKRSVCVGTTSVRTVETALLRGGLKGMTGQTNLFISPGFRFRGTGAMLTNFHLPSSTLLMLVCAFGNRDLILAAYRHAVAERYRFFSYGDCMLIE